MYSAAEDVETSSLFVDLVPIMPGTIVAVPMPGPLAQVGKNAYWDYAEDAWDADGKESSAGSGGAGASAGGKEAESGSAALSGARPDDCDAGAERDHRNTESSAGAGGAGGKDAESDSDARSGDGDGVVSDLRYRPRQAWRAAAQERCRVDPSRTDISPWRVLKAAETGNAELLRTELSCGSAEMAAVAVATRDPGWDMPPIFHACLERAGGTGSSGWLGCVVELLRADSRPQASVSLQVRGAGVDGVGHCSVDVLHACAALGADDSQTLAATAALVAYGAPSLTIHTTARFEKIARGGRGGLRDVLCREPHTLRNAPGWGVVAHLPRLNELGVEYARTLIASWAEERERKRKSCKPLDGTARYRIWSRLPRAALAEVLCQLPSQALTTDATAEVDSDPK